MAIPIQQVSPDAQLALTTFSEDFDGLLAAGAPDQWATQFGTQAASRAFKTTYPLPISAAGYKLREGDDKMRSLYTKSVSITPREWTDGVQELSSIIEAPDFIGWGSEPARIARESLRQPNTNIAALLEANANLELDGLSLFNNAHPNNVFDTDSGTFDNDQIGSADSALITAIKLRFRQRRAANGKRMGLRFTDLIVPPDLEEVFRSLLKDELLLQAVENQAGSENVGGVMVKNPHASANINLIVADELVQTDEVFALDRNGPPPWIMQNGGTPEEIRYDKDSDHWKDTGKIGIKYVMLLGEVGALPHAIERITIS